VSRFASESELEPIADVRCRRRLPLFPIDDTQTFPLFYEYRNRFARLSASIPDSVTILGGSEAEIELRTKFEEAALCVRLLEEGVSHVAEQRLPYTSNQISKTNIHGDSKIFSLTIESPSCMQDLDSKMRCMEHAGADDAHCM
jgi:hypothetical protein